MLSTSRRAAASTTIRDPGDKSWFSSATPVMVVTKVVRKATPSPARPIPSSSPTHQRKPTSSSGASSSSLTSLSSAEAPPKKRKLQDAPSKSSSASSSSKKRRTSDKPSIKVTTAPKPKKRAADDDSSDDDYGPKRARNKTALPLDHVFRYSRSRSTTAFEQADARRQRKTWSDEDGAVGDALISSEHVVKTLMHMYKQYFKNPADPSDESFNPHPENYPFVELEYPNDNASERFMLLEPKDKDHYNPIMCLELTLHTIIRYYLTPEQKALFGTLPEEFLRSPGGFSASPQTPSTAFSSPLSSPPTSQASTSSSPLTSLTDSSSSLTALSDSETSSRHSPVPSSNHLRVLNRAIHLRDGPKFLQTMKIINGLLRSLKNANGEGSQNPLRAVPRTWSKTGHPKKVLMRIIEETYQRCIGPHVAELRRYSAFSSEVYGELTPALISEVLRETGITDNSASSGEGKLFVDLGSGVGNVVLQAALQSGCRAFGVEIMKHCSELSRVQLEQMKLRCRMWGVEMGDVELVRGDMTACPRLDEILPQADVVLVNNFVFKEELNEALRPKFLDLKEGAIVVSLKPFAPPSNHQRLTERNIDDISTAIFDVTSRPYHSGTVSWSSGSGQYYLHRVDREGYKACRTQFERALGAGRKRGGRR